MKLLNERNQVREVAKEWKRQYSKYSGDFHSKDKFEIGEKLSALNPETATAKQVAEIIGNTSWVRINTCHECQTETWDAVQIGEEPDCESRTATICGNCLRAALKLLDN